MVHFRSQRGSLEESMRTVVDLRNRADLLEHLRRILAPMPVPPRRVGVRYYCYDARIGWPTFLVTVDGQAVGFTDGRI